MINSKKKKPLNQKDFGLLFFLYIITLPMLIYPANNQNELGFPLNHEQRLSRELPSSVKPDAHIVANQNAISAQDAIVDKTITINKFPASFEINLVANGFILEHNQKKYCLQETTESSDVLSVLIKLDPKAPVDQIAASAQETQNRLPKIVVSNTHTVKKFPASFEIDPVANGFIFKHDQREYSLEAINTKSSDVLSVLIKLDLKAPVNEAKRFFPFSGCSRRNKPPNNPNSAKPLVNHPKSAGKPSPTGEEKGFMGKTLEWMGNKIGCNNNTDTSQTNSDLKNLKADLEKIKKEKAEAKADAEKAKAKAEKAEADARKAEAEADARKADAEKAEAEADARKAEAEADARKADVNPDSKNGKNQSKKIEEGFFDFIKKIPLIGGFIHEIIEGVVSGIGRVFSILS